MNLKCSYLGILMYALEGKLLWNETLQNDVFLYLSLLPPPAKHQAEHAHGQTTCGELLLLCLVLSSFFPAFIDIGFWGQPCRSESRTFPLGFAAGLSSWTVGEQPIHDALLCRRQAGVSPAQSLEWPSLLEQVAGPEWMLPYLTDCTWNGFMPHSVYRCFFEGV